MNNLTQENPLVFDLPALDLTRFSEPPISQPAGEKFLVFYLGEELFAVSTKKVIEAAPSFPVTILPGAPEWLLGIANLRGEVISIINLPVVLRKKASKPAPKSKFIVIRSQIFESGVAFTADRISEIVILPNEEIQLNRDENSPHIYEKVVHKSQTLNIINTEQILSTLTIN